MAKKEEEISTLDLDVEFSLKNDESLNFLLEVIAVVIGKLVKTNEQAVVSLIN